MSSFIRLGIFILISCSLLFGTVSKTKASGVWTSAATWVSGIVPTTADTVIIASGHTVTINGDFLVEMMTVQTDATVQYDSAANRAITVRTDLTIDSLGKIIPSAPFLSGDTYQYIGIGRNLTVNGMIKDTVKGSVSGIRSIQQIKMNYQNLSSGKCSIQGKGSIKAIYLILQKSAGTDTVFVHPGPTINIRYLYLEGGVLENSKNSFPVFVVSRAVQSSVLTAVPNYAGLPAVSYLGGTNITSGIELLDTMYTISINLNKTVTFTKNVVLKSTLELSGSRLNMGNFTLKANGAVDNTGGLVKGYVIGTLEKPITQNKIDSVKVFEVGTASGYSEVKVRFDTVKTAGSLAVRSSESMYAQIKDTTLALKRSWTATLKNGLTMNKCDVTLRYAAADFKYSVSESGDEQSLIVGKYDLINFIGFWSYPTLGTRDTSGAGGTIQARGITDLNTTFVVVKNAKALSVSSAGVSPGEFSLAQNYPNPFNPVTTIAYRIAENGPAVLTVCDLLGKKVMTLADGHHAAGNYSVRLNGSQLSSGCYFYTLISGGKMMTKKLLLMK
jgi:hypothetical protein